MVKDWIERLLGGAVMTISLGFAACAGEDRVVSVTCGPSPGPDIAAQMGNAQAEGARIGFLNTRQFTPGTILDLGSDEAGRAPDAARVAYVLRTTERDFMPPRAEAWFGNVVNGSFSVRLEDDVRRALRSANVDWSKALSKNTAILIAATRKTLRDPVRLINGDKDAVMSLRNEGGERRFVVVSAVSYGIGLDLAAVNFSSRPEIANNTLEVAELYLHLKFSCSSIDQINSKTSEAEVPVPILFFYVPVRIDRESGTVMADAEGSRVPALSIDARDELRQ